MTDRTVSVRLKAEVSGYIASMKQAGAATRGLASEVDKAARTNSAEMQKVGRASLVMGAGLAAGVGLAVKKFANFDQAMSNVRAATHEAASGMAALREAALDAGARTVFSATEAAGAVEELAKAGVSTADILGGALDGALDLAAAGSLAVGDAASIAATAMTQFGQSGAKVPHIADLLAAAAGKAQGDVSDMGMALKQAGLVASQTGLSLEETTAGLAAFASAGLLGSDAGTSFKSMLQRLTPQSTEAQKAMEDLNISAYDAGGNFIGLEKFAGNLQDSLKGLTVEQRNSAMATIFGADAVRAAAVLYNQGAPGIAAWTKKVNDTGYAAETAAIKLDNLKGDVEQLRGSLETALIGSGAPANGVLRELAQSATTAANAFSDMPAPMQKATTTVAALAGGAALLGGGFLLAAPRIAETRTALDTLGKTAPRTTRALTTMGSVAGKASAAFGILATAVAVFGADAGSLRRFGAEVEAAAGDNTQQKIKALREEMDRLRAFSKQGFETGHIFWNDFGQGYKEAADKADFLQERIKDLESEMKVERLAAANAAVSTDEFGRQVNEAGNVTDDETDALLSFAAQANDTAAAIEHQTGSSEKGNAVLERSRTAFVKAAIAAGYTKREAKKLADQFFNMPPAVVIPVSAPGLASAAAQVAALNRGLHGLRRGAHFSVDGVGTGSTTNAAGGYIRGPGTATSDSIPSWLSDGEYVVKAAAVARYGTSFFDAANSMRLAAGGPASPRFATIPAPTPGGGPVVLARESVRELAVEMVNAQARLNATQARSVSTGYRR